MSKVRERAKRRAVNFAERLPPAVRPWYQAARPRSLPATYAALLIGGGIALSHDSFDLPRFVLALIGALLLQIASNFVNEYVDFTRGTDEKKVAGMGMVLSNAQLTARQVLIGAVVTTLGGALIGLLLTVFSGPQLLIVGGVGVAAVVLYTAGPLPLSYIGLGELTAFLCFGPLMTYGTYFAVTGKSAVLAALAGIPIGFTVAAILHANNMRDLESDLVHNKRTLANILGRQASRWEYLLLISGSFVVLALLVALGEAPLMALLPLLALPTGIGLVRRASHPDEPRDLNRLLRATASLHSTFGWLMILGFVAATVVRL